jgi:hypothetical protein
MKLLRSSVVVTVTVLVLAWPVLGDGGAAAKPTDKPAPAAFAPAPHVTAQEVDTAIAKGVSYFRSKQRPNGLFGSGLWQLGGGIFQAGGDEVCAMAALAYAGESLTKPEMMKGLRALMDLDVEDTYTLGFRLIALAEFHRHGADAKFRTAIRQTMKRDADKLVALQGANGGWGYSPKGLAGYWDFSNTQIAVLGLQQAVSCGVEIKLDVFAKAAELYLLQQQIDGGWGYGWPAYQYKQSYGSMTAAGVASMFLLRAILNPGAGCPCQGETSPGRRSPRIEEAIKRGLKWIDENFSANNNPNSQNSAPLLYWFYSMERVGMATGFKYLGRHDWYAEGAARIIGLQKSDGSWNDEYSDMSGTAIALLFLIKGRGPILMNKLQYDGTWDLHPHDLENLARYVGNAKEQQIKWQVIDLRVPVEEMHDAPILYLSAESPLKFSDAEKKKLRDFTDTGGTILFEASCGNRNVDLGWRKTCQEIWPEWELKKLDKTHPLWTADLKILNPPPLWGASDGVRIFLLYAPQDVSCVWNMNAVDKNKGQFDLGSNLWAYTTDRGKLRGKLESHEVGTSPKYAATQPAKGGGAAAITVARLRHGGDWNVARNYHEWATLSAATSRLGGLTITEAEPVAPGVAVPAGTTMLYLSGRASCDLDAAGQAWLKNYLAGSGFLFAEAALGDKRFDESLRAMIGTSGLTFKRMDATSPLISGQLPAGAIGYNVNSVGYTYALRDERMGKPLPELLGLYLGEKLVGVYSPYDIMFRQTGCEAFDCRGYDADDARALAVNVALYASTLAASDPAAPNAGSASATSATSAASSDSSATPAAQ